MSAEFIVRAMQEHAVNPQGQRVGQFIMNKLHKERPDLYQAVTGTASDPFSDDKRMPAFWVWCTHNW